MATTAQGMGLEERAQAIERELLAAARREHAQLTTLNRWTKEVLSWCLEDPHLKSQVLKFIDTLPSLRTPRAVVRRLQEYFPREEHRLPAALQLGVALSKPGLLTAPAVAAVVHQAVEQVARQFIAGASPDDAVRVLERLAARGALASFDLLGEAVVSDAEADAYARRYTSLIRHLSEKAPGLALPQELPRLGPAVHVSIKPSAMTSRFLPLAFDASVERALARLRPIAHLASELGAGITLDMEQYELRDLTIELAKRLLLEPFGDRLALGIVIQAYLRDAEAVTIEMIDWLRQHRRRLSVRLVKGAYWDSEVAEATKRGWPVPVFTEKRQSDLMFDTIADRLVAAHPTVHSSFASHNLHSIAHAMAAAERAGLAREAVEFQLLYGMGDAIQGAISSLRYPVRVYTPVGQLIPGMAYLVRRIMENTANESFLRQDFLHGD